MSGSSGAFSWEALAIGVCVVGVLAAAVVYAARSNSRRAAGVREAAARRGWTFSPTDEEGLSARIDRFFPDERFRLDSIVGARPGAEAVRLFACSHHTRDQPGNSRYSTGGLIESSRFAAIGARVEILPRSRINEATVGSVLPLGSPGFSQSFLVVGQDRAAAERALTGALQAAVLAHGRSPLFQQMVLVLDGTGAVVLVGPNADPQEWEALVGLLRAVEAAVP